MVGFDTDVSVAIGELAQTLVKNDYCALYEFGEHNRVVRTPQQETCNSLFSRYSISAADGGTPLFATLEKAYLDIQNIDVLSAVVVISDGAPSDSPSSNLSSLSMQVPTFVIWVGNHTT